MSFASSRSTISNSWALSHALTLPSAGSGNRSGCSFAAQCRRSVLPGQRFLPCRFRGCAWMWSIGSARLDLGTVRSSSSSCLLALVLHIVSFPQISPSPVGVPREGRGMLPRGEGYSSCPAVSNNFPERPVRGASATSDVPGYLHRSPLGPSTTFPDGDHRLRGTTSPQQDLQQGASQGDPERSVS